MLDSDALAGTWDFKKKEVGIYKTISRARTRSSDLQVQATFCTLSRLFEPMATSRARHCPLLGPDTVHSWGQTLAVRHLTGHRYRIALQSYSQHKTVCPTTYYVFIYHHIGCGASPSKAVAWRSSSTIVDIPSLAFLLVNWLRTTWKSRRSS
jgi:hypothetical protein